LKKLTREDISREIKEGIKLDAEGFRLLIRKLKPVKHALEKTVDREKNKRAERAATFYEYDSETAIQDAYGYDLITDFERRQLLEQLETGEKYVENTQTRANVALFILQTFIMHLTKQAMALEFELLPPEEQEKRIKSSEEIRERVEARRTARWGVGNAEEGKGGIIRATDDI